MENRAIRTTKWSAGVAWAPKDSCRPWVVRMKVMPNRVVIGIISHRLGAAAGRMPCVSMVLKPITSMTNINKAAEVAKKDDSANATATISRVWLMATGAARPTAIMDKAKIEIIGARLLFCSKS